MVDILVVDDDLRMTALHETGHQLFHATGIFHGTDLCTRDHTVANLRFGEVKRILENLHLILYLLIILGILDGWLYEIVEDVNYIKFI